MGVAGFPVFVGVVVVVPALVGAFGPGSLLLLLDVGIGTFFFFGVLS